MIPGFWYRWLFVVILIVMLFGASMVATPDVIRQFFGLLIYSAPGAIEAGFGVEANAYITLVHGVLGTVMLAWGVAMMIALTGPFARGQREGWVLIAVPLMVWYLVDTGFSLYIGFWRNAVLNTVLAILFGVPLVATRRYFRLDTSD